MGTCWYYMPFLKIPGLVTGGALSLYSFIEFKLCKAQSELLMIPRVPTLNIPLILFYLMWESPKCDCVSKIIFCLVTSNPGKGTPLLSDRPTWILEFWFFLQIWMGQKSNFRDKNKIHERSKTEIFHWQSERNWNKLNFFRSLLFFTVVLCNFVQFCAILKLSIHSFEYCQLTHKVSV